MGVGESVFYIFYHIRVLFAVPGATSMLLFVKVYKRIR